jgi:hypothetical protein
VKRSLFLSALAGGIAATVSPFSSWALTGIQIGASGETYASAGLQCGLHPTRGMAPMVQAGLYNPKKSASGTVSLNGSGVAAVNFVSPDATVWLANGANAVSVSAGRRSVDGYAFDASLAFSGQPNACIPDTRGNTVSADLEYAQSLKSYATVIAGCAMNPLTGRSQPYVHLFDNGAYLLNVSVNNTALTQLNGTTRPQTAVFLSPGLNVIAAANASVSTDYFVRDAGTGSCTLP